MKIERAAVAAFVGLLLAAGVIAASDGARYAQKLQHETENAKFKPGDVAYFIMGGQPAHILTPAAYCRTPQGCTYEVRAFDYKSAPRTIPDVREWELRRE